MIKINASKPFKISLRICTNTDDYYWITYLSSNDEPIYHLTERLIEIGIENDLTLEGDWYSLKRHIPTDLDEAYADFNFKYFDKIEIMGTNFKVLSINIFNWANEWYEPYYMVSNFGWPDLLRMDDPFEELGWDLSDPDCFSLEYDDTLNQYLQALGPLPESEDQSSSSSYNYAPDSILYSPTDYGSYYSPYSPMGGYYGSYYGSGGYGAGYGYPGLGYGANPFGGIYGGLGLGGLGLGGLGLSYLGYGSPYSIYGGIGVDPSGLGLSPLTGIGLGISPLLSGLNTSPWLDNLGLLNDLGNLPTTTLSVPTLVPSTTDIDLSSFLGFGGLGISGLSDITIPVQTFVPGTTTINIPDFSSFLSIDY